MPNKNKINLKILNLKLSLFIIKSALPTNETTTTYN